MARSLPLFLRIAAADPAPDTAAQPWELVDRARKRLGPEPEGMLLRLARADLREFDEETIRTVLLFPPPGEQLAELVASLCASGLMQRVRAGRFQVHPGVRALLPPPRQLPIRWRALHDAAHSRVRAALHGTGRPLSGETIEDWLELIQQMIRVPSVGSVHLAGTLARYLAEQNDPHRLFALRAIVANHVLPETESSIVVPIAMAARRVGQLDQAEHLLRTANRREAAPELALVLRDSGRLLEAIAVLDEEHAERASVEEDPPALLARGAVRCDQGWHEEAERALSQAASRLAGRAARRDMAWARLEQGRCELLLGHLQSAENLIDAARETFRMLADERGVAWATTEYGRLHLLLGPDDALALLNEAEAMHRATEDARGMDWTDLCQELALNEPVSPDPPGWHWPMRKNPDRLLRAWRLHFAVARPDAQPDRLSLEATSLFKAMGCPRGQAWSLLTEGLTNLATGSDDWIAQALEQCAEAERLFQTIGDGTAKGWQQYVRLRHRIPQRLQDVLTPDRPALKLPPWWSQPSISEDSPYTLPLLARLTILPVTAADSASDETAESDDACRVRLTLLDDSPTVQAAARILLQVEPGARHPWADLAKAPYLSAVALPLTRGTLVPHTALLRASTQAEHGAQFLFRSERPGRHRMRFTIVDDASGTVLQQVETEVDLTPAPPARTVLSPFPHRSER
ncbi:tetratricopeptide repeat protein [Streptomyces coeruleorubidus]|uniref:Tetratricopeptide repeat protein n=1 Tax=Streptomyces coeruleorubidus TaxID=116188 RepID=A0ABZ0KRU0_STRC4|nr:tetratricopeptide repeat protein [Streptomyces coeruleorubidus]WOT40553.1 tetratricopeptide repeat protein [Streptomyces coeruleorubidus]